MSPFREVPHVELGPLEVGLAGAAERATRRLPQGGRLVGPLSRKADGGHATRGAVGSAGLLFLFVVVILANAGGFRPTSLLADFSHALPVLLVGVAVGGASLALVFRALEGGEDPVARSGDLVGQRAGSVLSSLAGLESTAERAFVDPRSIHWLRRVLAAAADPDVEPWIPADVRGRAELLLAREIAAYQGLAFGLRDGARGEVASLLIAASRHLDDASPARADLAALEQSPHAQVHRVRRALRRHVYG